MAKNAVHILFDVKGGGSLNGDSGKEIVRQLQEIAQKINEKDSKRPKIAIRFDTTKAIKELKKELQGLEIGINIGGIGTKKGSSFNPNNKSNIFTSLKNQLQEYYKARNELIKKGSTDNRISEGLLNGNLTSTENLSGIEEQARSYISLRDAIRDTTAVLDGYNNGTISAKDAASKLSISQEELIQLTDRYNKLSTQSKIAQEKYGTSANDVYTRVTNKARRMLSELDQQGIKTLDVQKAYNSLKTTLDNSDGNPKSIEDIRKAMEDLNNAMIKNENYTETWFHRFKKTFETRVRSVLAGIVTLSISRYLRQIYSDVLDINSAMTQLKIVTNESDAAFLKYSKDVTASAKRIGASIPDLINSTTTYARLGYSLPVSEKLAEITTAYSKVGDISVDDATTNITGIIKAYKIGSNDLESVVDKLIYVGNKFPISSAQIGEGMNNAASSLVESGNTLDQALGILSAANTTVQDISKSSTAVRTITARLSASKAILAELGEDDGTITTVAKLRDEFRGFGIEISKGNGELYSTYEILKQIADKWNTFNDTQRKTISGLAAGNRQQYIFDALIQNFADAEKIVADIGEAQGALNAATEKRLNSIQGKVDVFKASLQELSTILLDSNLVKDVVDLGSGLLKIAKVLAEILSYVGGLKLILFSIGSTFLIKKIPTIAKGISAIGTAVKAISANTGFAKSIVAGLDEIGVKATAAQVKLSLLSAALAVVFIAISSYISYQKEAYNSALQSAEANLEEAKSYKEKAEGLNALIAEYQSLAFVEADYSEKAASIQEKIRDVIGEQADNLDLVNGKLDEQLRTLKFIQFGSLKKSKKEAETALKDAKNAYFNKAGSLEERVNPYVLGISTLYGLINNTGDIKKLFEDYGASYFTDFGTAFDPSFSTERMGIQTVFDSTEDFVKQYKALKEMKTGLANDTSKDWSSSTLYSQINKYLSDYADVYSAITQAQSNLDFVLEKINPQNPDKTNAPLKLKTTLEVLDELQDSYDALANGLKDIEKYGYLSASSVEKLFKLEEEGKLVGVELSDVLEKTEKGYVLNTNAVDEFAKAIIAKRKLDIAEAKTTEDRETATENLRTYIAVLETLGLTYEEIASALDLQKDALNAEKDALNGQLDKYKELIETRKSLLKTYQSELKYQNELNKKQSGVARLQQQLSLAQLDSSAAGKAKMRSLAEELTNAQEDLEEFTLDHAIELITNDLDDQYNEYKKYIDRRLQEINNALDELKQSAKEIASNTGGSQGDKLLSPSEFNKNTGLLAHFGTYLGYLFGFTPTYHSGGIVGDVLKTKESEQFAKLLKGEFVSTPSQMKSFINDTLPKLITFNPSGKMEIKSPLVEINCDNVSNESMPKLKEVVNEAVDEIKKILDGGMSRTGRKGSIKII